MACIRKRRGRYVVDYRDAAGIRRWLTCETRREADAALARVLREAGQETRPTVDPAITVADYATHWLASIAASVKAGTLKPRTAAHYAAMLNRHLLPALGRRRVRDLDRGRVKALLVQKLDTDLAPATVSIIHRTLRAMLSAAVDDGVLLANPAARLGRALRIVPSKAARQEEIKAMTRAQVSAFLAEAERHAPRWYPLLLLLARTGLRIGEALAVQWDDVDLAGRTVRVARALGDNGVDLDTPKSGHGRDVDLSAQLVATLRALDTATKARALRTGQPQPVWVFPSEASTPLDPHNVRRAFRRMLKRAALPPHFTPHCLRHTFASILIADGAPIAYVQRQLGHASIQLTVDTYGKWLPMAGKGTVDRLDDPGGEASGSKAVAKSDATYSEGRTTPWKVRETAVRSGGYEVGRVGLEPTTRCLKATPEPGQDTLSDCFLDETD